MQAGEWEVVEGVEGELGGGEGGSPLGNQRGDLGQVQPFEVWVVGGEAGLGEAEEGVGGTEAVLLQVDEGSGQLDQALVEFGDGLAALLQPEVFENVVRLVEVAPVEAGEPAGVAGVEAVGVVDAQVGDAFGFGHGAGSGVGVAMPRREDGTGPFFRMLNV